MSLLPSLGFRQRRKFIPVVCCAYCLILLLFILPPSLIASVEPSSTTSVISSDVSANGKMASSSNVEWVHMESNELQEERLRETNHAVTWLDRAHPETMHECTFHLKNPRQADLEALVLQISDPKSPMYGKHMTKDQVHEMTRNAEGEQALDAYLQKIGATITKKMSSAVTASAPIHVWEQAFHTELYRLQSPAISHELVRAKHYSLPSDVAPYVQLVTNLIDLPVPIHRGPRLNRPIGIR